MRLIINIDDDDFHIFGLIWPTEIQYSYCICLIPKTETFSQTSQTKIFNNCGHIKHLFMILFILKYLAFLCLVYTVILMTR